MAVLAWIADPTGDFLREMFVPGGPQNIYGCRNPDVAVLLADIQREPDQSRRLELIRRAERLILTDSPVVPLLYYRVP
jgi:oligopeptide transport system substrate-binding protein